MLLVVVALMALATTHSANASRDEPHTSTTKQTTLTQVTSMQPTTSSPPTILSVNAVTMLPDGRMFSFGVADIFSIRSPTYGRYSTDCGRTWGTAFSLPPAFITSIVAAYGKLFVMKQDFNTNERWILVSTNNGATWNMSQQLPSLGYQVASAMNGLLARNGAILIPFSYSLRPDDTNYTSSVWVSTDQGITWVKGGDVYVLSGADEPSLTEASDGAILMVTRTTAGGSHYIARSHDNGLTWSTPQTTGLYDPSAPANIFRVSWNPNILGIIWNAGPGRTHLTIAYSHDDAQTWVSRQELYAGNSEYPLAEVCQGMIFISYWTNDFQEGQMFVWLSTTSTTQVTTTSPRCRECEPLSFWAWLVSAIAFGVLFVVIFYKTNRHRVSRRRKVTRKSSRREGNVARNSPMALFSQSRRGEVTNS